jgi:hypothetical protein
MSASSSGQNFGQARNHPEAGSSICYPLYTGFLAYFPTLKVEVTCSSEMPVDFEQTAWSYIPEDTNLHQTACLFTLQTLNLKMEAVHSFKMLVNFYQTTQLHIPQNSTLHSHDHENLKSTLNVHIQYKKSTINISVHQMYIFCTVQHVT